MLISPMTAFEVLRDEDYGPDATHAILRGIRPTDLMKLWEDYHSFGGPNAEVNFAKAHNVTHDYIRAALAAGRELSEPLTPEGDFRVVREFQKQYGHYALDVYEKAEN